MRLWGSSRVWAATMVLCAVVAHGDQPDEIDVLLARAATLTSPQVRRAGQAVPLYRQAIRLARDRNDSARLAPAYSGLGNALISLHDQKGAREALEEARRIARRAGLHTVEAETLTALGLLNFELARSKRQHLVRQSEAIAARHHLDAWRCVRSTADGDSPARWRTVAAIERGATPAPPRRGGKPKSQSGELLSDSLQLGGAIAGQSPRLVMCDAPTLRRLSALACGVWKVPRHRDWYRSREIRGAVIIRGPDAVK